MPRPRVQNRDAMNAILFVLRTGCQWNALNGTGLCSSSSAHRRFLEWTEAGVFEKAWVRSLRDYDASVGIDWRWLSMDGALSKAPLGGGKNWTQSNRPRQGRHQTQRADGGSAGIPVGVAVDGANRVDFKLAREESIPIRRPRPTKLSPQGLCLDKGYDYAEVDALVDEFRLTGHIARRGQEPRRDQALGSQQGTTLGGRAHA